MESYQELQRPNTTGASLGKPNQARVWLQSLPISPQNNMLKLSLLKMEPLKSIQEFLDTQAKATQKQREGQVPAKLLTGLEVLPVSLTALRRCLQIRVTKQPWSEAPPSSTDCQQFNSSNQLFLNYNFCNCCLCP